MGREHYEERDWALDVTGHGIDSGHHVAEQAPDESPQHC